MAIDPKTKKTILGITIATGIGALIFAVIRDQNINRDQADTGTSTPPPQGNTALPPKLAITPKPSNPSGSTVTVPKEIRYAITLKDTVMYKDIKPGAFGLYNSLQNELGTMPKGFYLGKVIEVEDSSTGYVRLARLIGGKSYFFYVLKDDFYFGGKNIKFILPTDKYTLPTSTLTKDFLSNWIQY